jgi:hypothetical protein
MKVRLPVKMWLRKPRKSLALEEKMEANRRMEGGQSRHTVYMASSAITTMPGHSYRQ